MKRRASQIETETSNEIDTMIDLPISVVALQRGWCCWWRVMSY